jgi:hypothetical protein
MADIDIIDSDIEEYSNAFDETDRTLLTLLGGLLVADTGLDIITTNNAVNESIVASGYFDVVNDMLNTEYQDIIDLNYNSATRKFGALQYSDETIAELQAIKQLDFTKFNQLSQDAANDLTRIVSNFQMGTISRIQTVEQMRVVTNNLKNYSKTWVDTAISGYYRKSKTNLLIDNGINKFKYVGPRDKVTRPFCDAHIGQIKTKEQWSQLSNEQGLPVFEYGGGYRCRHDFVGVVK